MNNRLLVIFLPVLTLFGFEMQNASQNTRPFQSIRLNYIENRHVDPLRQPRPLVKAFISESGFFLAESLVDRPGDWSETWPEKTVRHGMFPAECFDLLEQSLQGTEDERQVGLDGINPLGLAPLDRFTRLILLGSDLNNMISFSPDRIQMILKTEVPLFVLLCHEEESGEDPFRFTSSFVLFVMKSGQALLFSTDGGLDPIPLDDYKQGKRFLHLEDLRGEIRVTETELQSMFDFVTAIFSKSDFAPRNDCISVFVISESTLSSYPEIVQRLFVWGVDHFISQ